MLLTCTQIYHEAVGILYQSHTFLISANLHKHNAVMGQISDAAQFMHIIGSHSNLLTKVMADISPLCPEDCDDVRHTAAAEQIDLLPLVSMLWSRPVTQNQMYFTRSGRNLDSRVHPFSGDELVHDIDHETLSRVVQAIGTGDLLKLKRYGCFERLISNMWITRELDMGWVVFQSTPRVPRY
jgi:hypothetical protein